MRTWGVFFFWFANLKKIIPFAFLTKSWKKWKNILTKSEQETLGALAARSFGSIVSTVQRSMAREPEAAMTHTSLNLVGIVHTCDTYISSNHFSLSLLFSQYLWQTLSPHAFARCVFLKSHCFLQSIDKLPLYNSPSKNFETGFLNKAPPPLSKVIARCLFVRHLVSQLPKQVSYNLAPCPTNTYLDLLWGACL